VRDPEGWNIGEKEAERQRGGYSRRASRGSYLTQAADEAHGGEAIVRHQNLVHDALAAALLDVSL
jgi:hypothetical protein